jgi:hypothetical protein
MELKRDDWVKTESDEVGRVVHISRLTVFVALTDYPRPDRVEAYRESQLTKVAGPEST